MRSSSSDLEPQTRLIAAHCLIATGCLVATLLPGVGTAQVSLLEDGAPRFEWSGGAQADFLNEFETETDGGDKVESWRVGVAAELGGPINESILVGFQARYRYAKYDFHLDNGRGRPNTYGGSELPKAPWGAIDTIDLVPTSTVLVGSRGAVKVAVPIRWSGEVGTDRNAFSAGISALASWQVTDRFRAGVGIGVTSQIEEDAETFPILALDWQVTDRLHLATEGDWAQGGGASLAWEPIEEIAFSVSAGYERNRFRLDDNGTTPDTNGVGEITEVPIEVGLRIGKARGARLDVRMGFGFAGHLRVEDSDGDKLYEESYDPAPRIGIAVTLPIGPSAP